MAGFTGIGNISPITVSILAQPFQAVALKPGQIFQGVVQSVEPQTLLRFGAMVIPVERIEGVQPGQAVSAEVMDSGDAVKLRITPQHTPIASTTRNEPNSLPDFIVDVLRTLGKLEIVEQAVHLVPRHIAQNATAVRLALTLLLDENAHNNDARRVLQLIQSAVDDGAVAMDDVKAAVHILRVMAGDDSLDSSVRQLGDTMSRSPLEARLSEALSRGDVKAVLDAMHDELLPVLERLRDHSSLHGFLRKTGNAGDFTGAIDRLIERFVATQLLNARGMDFPYMFFDVPVAADGPIRRAQIHIMGEGGGKEKDVDTKNASIVFDIVTETLGALWITVGIAQGACSCWLRAQDMTTVELLTKHGPRLAEQLSGAGYPNASVHASLWDGDRVRELSTLMRRFEGIDMKA